MPTLGNGPSPKQFATAWTRGFAAAVRDAAGRDGRLSLNEARQIAKRSDGLAVYGDNAVNYLEKTGQQSVSVEKLIGKGHDYAFALAERVSGGNNRVSLVEAEDLPADLRADFMALRGRPIANAPVAQKLDAAALKDALTAATKFPDGDEVYYMSEGDYPVVPFTAENPTGKVDGATVLKRLAGELKSDIFDYAPNGNVDLVTETYTKADTERFFANLAEPWIGMDEISRKTAEAFGTIGDLINDNLSDVRIVKVGEPGRNGDLSVDQGTYAYVAVGQTDDGKMAGVFFGAVET